MTIKPDLLASATSGDQLAIDRLLRPLLEPAYRLAYMMLRDRYAAEDAVQEAALKCWRKLPTLVAGRDPLPWFLGFVANECRNARRSRWRSVLTLGERNDLVAPPAPPANDPDLMRALAQLRHRDRLVILMFFYLDMPLPDIAEATGSRSGAVRSRLYRSIATLRRHLRAAGESIDG